MYLAYVKCFKVRYDSSLGRDVRTGETGKIAPREISAKDRDQAFERYCEMIERESSDMYWEPLACVRSAIKHGIADGDGDGVTIEVL